MHRRFSLLPATIGALALVAGGMTIDLHAQRGGGAAGHGRPVTAGTQAQGHGRPDNPGAQGQAHRPDTDQPATHGKDAGARHEAGTTGRPTVSDQLARNTNLASRLQTLFPAGTDLSKESAGFRNLGQFVAAAHVSHNLDIPWADLKAKMTGDHRVSLGKAIQDLKPQTDAKTEANKAEKEADTDIKDSSKTKTTTAS
jgi:hypothetical protein